MTATQSKSYPTYGGDNGRAVPHAITLSRFSYRVQYAPPATGTASSTSSAPPPRAWELVDFDGFTCTLAQCATMILDAECTVVTDSYRNERLFRKEIAQGG